MSRSRSCSANSSRLAASAWLALAARITVAGTLVACESVPAPPPACTSSPRSGDPFVRADGTQLCLGGERFRFVGVNRYDLLSSSVSPCGRTYDDAELDQLCAEAAAVGARVVRTWAFAHFTDGGANFSALDRLLAAAKKYDLRLILTLENEWRDCTDADPATTDGRKGVSWFTDGWHTTFEPHAQALVSRYRDEPQIVAWQLMNEAECPDAAVLRQFAVDASTLVRSLAPHHLISLGTIGSGQAGTQGNDYLRLHEIPTIDLVEAHDYGSEREAWPSSVSACFAVARALGKPFFIGEAGIAAPSPLYPFSYAERAQLFDAKLAAALRQHETSGYLVWSFYDLLASSWEGWTSARQTHSRACWRSSPARRSTDSWRSISEPRARATLGSWPRSPSTRTRPSQRRTRSRPLAQLARCCPA